MIVRQKILVTGANGQLGKSMQRAAPSFPQFEFIFLSREDLPIHHFEMARHYFNTYHPQYLVNCAGYTAVDRAESEKDLAFQVNGEAVGVLAAICRENNTRFLHVSTDYVFDGMATQPYREDDVTHPGNVYGASKREGEIQALHFNPDTIIIRTSWLYSEFGKNFVRTMLKMMREKKEISVVNDQQGSPTYAGDLAEAIGTIIAGQQWHPGIYHFSNRGIISWYDFALAIKEIKGYDCLINPIPASQYPTPARRPAYSALDNHKIREIFGIPAKDWKESLNTCLDHLRK